MKVETHNAEFVAAAVDYEGLPPPAFTEIAFAGRSNVGKSSLINKLLLRRNLVRTSSRPGATRGLALFRSQIAIHRADKPVQLATLDLLDLPGYGYAKRSKSERRSWGPMIEAYLSHRVGLKAVVVLVDIRRGLEEDDLQLLEFLQHVRQEVVLTATKLDKLPSSKQLAAVAALKQQVGRPVVGVSAHTGDGRDRLWSRLLAASGLS